MRYFNYGSSYGWHEYEDSYFLEISKRYDGKTQCRACGSLDHKFEYHSNLIPKWHRSEDYSDSISIGGAPGIKITCNVCGYSWNELPCSDIT